MCEKVIRASLGRAYDSWGATLTLSSGCWPRVYASDEGAAGGLG